MSEPENIYEIMALVESGDAWQNPYDGKGAEASSYSNQIASYFNNPLVIFPAKDALIADVRAAASTVANVENAVAQQIDNITPLFGQLAAYETYQRASEACDMANKAFGLVLNLLSARDVDSVLQNMQALLQLFRIDSSFITKVNEIWSKIKADTVELNNIINTQENAWNEIYSYIMNYAVAKMIYVQKHPCVKLVENIIATDDLKRLLP